MNIGKIGFDYLQNIVYNNFRRNIMVEDNNKKVDKVAEITKKIKDLEHKEKYSKNQMEKRNLRSMIGKLQRDLVIAKKENKK